MALTSFAGMRRGSAARDLAAGRTMKTNQWQHAFRENQYLILEEVLTEPLLSVAHEYAIKRALLSRETTSAGAAPGTPSFYGDPLMDTLLDLFQSVAETFAGLELYPTFSDLRIYGRGAIVNPHMQRPAGEITLSVSLGFDGPTDLALLSGHAPWVASRRSRSRRRRLVPRLRISTLARRVRWRAPYPGVLSLRRSPRAQRRMEVRQAADVLGRERSIGALHADRRARCHELRSRRKRSLACPQQHPDVLQATLDDETLLYHPDGMTAFALNATASVIWQLCNGERASPRSSRSCRRCTPRRRRRCRAKSTRASLPC